MSAPFRELFVELGKAAMDALHAMAEPRVQTSSRHNDPWLETRLDRFAINLVMRRLGWLEVETHHRRDLQTEILAVLACGHRALYLVDDLVMRSAQNPVYALMDAVEKQPRRCFCVPRQDGA